MFRSMWPTGTAPALHATRAGAPREGRTLRPVSSGDVVRPGIHTLPADQVYAALETGPRGLAIDDLQRRLARYGRNVIPEVRRAPLSFQFLQNFTHVMALLLWVGGAIAFITQTPELGVAIWMVNVINGSFSFWQEYRAEKALEALRRVLPVHARVYRAGEEHRVVAEALVPGDVVLLSEGDRISADARVVEAADLTVDQSSLTGESRPVRKTDRPLPSGEYVSLSDLPNLVYAGTVILSGHGRAVVVATGAQTVFGEIAHLTQTVGDELNPLQRELRRLTRRITALSLALGAVFFLLGHRVLAMTWPQSFLLALGMIVAFVPEGLVPTVTLSLALAVQRMARRNALIKRLSSVEALGRTSVICTDKTGTLTQNAMTVTGVWMMGQAFTVTGTGFAPQGDILPVGASRREPLPDDLRRVLLAAGLCTNTRLLAPHTESAQWTVLGDPMEAALLVVAGKAGIDLPHEGALTPRVHDIPFDSRRRRMTTIHQGKDHRIAYTKGSPFEMLTLCTTYWSQGAIHPLGERERVQVREATDQSAQEGLRVLAVAQRDLPSDDQDTPQDVECQMTFLGLVALYDPPRSDVPEAVDRCRRAGVRIIMLTGDYGRTAEGLARTIGILRHDRPCSLSSADLQGMSAAALREALRDDVIFSRITPEDKLRVVTTLREMGHIVAVTGDGVNDAPALRAADIGIAMGVSGTEVAKEAADMILADDHFASIVNAIEEGRAVYDNIRKFTTYVFGSNVAEGVPFVVTLFSRGLIPLPITVMQTLAVDLGTDMVPAIGLGAEAPEGHVMDRPPRSPLEPLLSARVIILGLMWYGVIDAIAALSAYVFANWEHGWPTVPLASTGSVYAVATTMTFAGIVCAQAGAALACRSEHVSVFGLGVSTNRLVIVGLAIEVAILLLLMYVPALRSIFNTAPITVMDWAFVVAWAPGLLLLDELRKSLQRRRPSRAL